MKRLLSIASLAVCMSMFTSCARQDKDLAQLRMENAKQDQEFFYRNVNIPKEAMGLDDFISLGLMQNFDVLVREQQIAIEREAATGEKLRMLPSLNADASYSHRSKIHSMGSVDRNTGAETIATTISSEKHSRKYGAELAWSILDFGLTYYRAKQQDNRHLMAMQDYKRLKQNLILDITEAYWKTVVAKKAVAGASSIITMVEDRKASLDKQIKNRTVPEIEGLQNEELLIEMNIKLSSYKNEVARSKARLASLVGLPPMTTFDVEDGALGAVDVDMWAVERLEEAALYHRPELYAQDLQVEISRDDVRSAVVQMFPNVEPFAGFNHDGNRFLLHNNWTSVGARASWNLLSLPSRIFDKKSAEARVEAARNARMSLSIGILTQVHLSLLEYQDSHEQYNLAVELSSVKTRLLEAGKKEQRQGEFDSADILRLEAEALFAQVYKATAYADLMVSVERVANTVGKPLLFSDVDLFGKDTAASMMMEQEDEGMTSSQEEMTDEAMSQEMMMTSDSKDVSWKQEEDF